MKTYRPKSIPELLDIISETDCYKLAGGTDLMIRKRNLSGAMRKFDKDVVMIHHLAELHGVKDAGDTLEVMACTTHAEMTKSDLLPDVAKEVYSLMGNPAVRNVATVGGNIVNAASVGDSLPLLFALDASVVLLSLKGERTLHVDDFLLGKYKTAIRPDEILYKVILPKKEISGHFYKKLGTRKASILSKLSVVVTYYESEGNLTDIAVAIGAVNNKPIRSRKLEEEFLSTKDIDAFIEGIGSLMNPSDDRRSTAEYRREVSLNILRENLGKLVNQ